MIPVSVCFVAACVLALTGCWSIGHDALTVGLFFESIVWLGLAVVRSAPPKADR